MHQVVEDKRDELNQLCQRFKVRRLDLFGSAADSTFDPQKSDLDFLVEFLPLSPGEHYEFYFGLLEGLEFLFQRPVDLVMVRAIRNPYFLKAINRTRVVLYAA